jgi:peptidyl-prolyl cis-trans isomerase SurA
MHFKNILFFIFLLSFAGLNAQQRKKVLFTVDKQPVYTDEFMKVFNKNRNIVSEENKKSIEEYLELYINYKLKLRQAYDLKYDTVSAYKKELAQYKEQLIAPYLKDNTITDKLVREAYERTKKEVNASHILIRLQPKATPKDTLKAYQKIMEARNKIIEGTPFETVAKQYSEDPSVQKNGGNLGYFSAFAMVYPFENAAYQTNVGEISQPFRTQFGYHIVEVNAVRDSKGEVEVAHIMIKNDKKDSLQAKTKIYELFAKLNQGMDFELLARQQSEDRSSAVNGGKLAKFNATRMIKSFADVAFSLKNENDISTPFQTRYGWHIVKLIKKYPIGDFNSVKDELTRKIEKSKRYKLAGTSIVKRLIKEYHITKNTELLQSYFNNDTAVISKNSATAIFSINGVTTALGELLKYDWQLPNRSAKDIFTDFFETKVLAYYKDNLEKTDPSFAFTLQEYKDGLLLFDLLQDKVWKRAEQDTLGLKAFFTKNQDKYFWKKRGDVIIASCTRKDKALLVKKYLEEGKEIDEIKKLVNDGPIIHVLFTRRVVEENHDKLPKGFVFDTVGVSDVIDDGNGFTIVKTFQIMPPQPMLLSEAKGNVINDYQDYLDKQWIRELRQQYPVKVKKKVLKKLIKQNQQ